MRAVSRFVLVSCLALSALSCAGAPSEPPARPVVPPPAGRGFREPPRSENGRLAAGVTPTRYEVDLDVDPNQARFAGRVRIEVSLAADANTIVLHGRDLAVRSAVAKDARGADHAGRLALTRSSDPKGPADELVLSFEPPLPAGKATLSIDYDAPFGRALVGLYRAKDRGQSYAFTQFEPSDARRALPCFDEPQHKTPFVVNVRVPRGMIALSNAPETTRTNDGDRVRFSFAPTEPIPSYLLALAVGDFDIVSDPRSKLVRIVTTKGRGEAGRPALAPTIEILDWLEKYLGVRYPYAKLDLVSVPDFGPGAMENPGLITFREELLLSDPSRYSPSGLRAREHVIAHELAHQWFGNLVTMNWWDDLWLNESFATWLSARALESLRPAYKADLGVIRGALGVMEMDALPSARPVRRPVRGTSDALDAFDGMTYEKGAAVIRMLEASVTPPRFRAGLKAYLETHAHKTARTEDLLAAIATASEGTGDPLGVAKTFLEQPGVPTIAVERDCRRKDGVPTLILSQYPWAPLGSGPPAQPLKQWTLPVCTRESKNPVVCNTVRERRAEIPLTRGCSSWAYPNAGQASYYRLSFPAADVHRLLGNLKELSAAERLGLIANLWAQTRAGELAPDVLVSALKAYDGERDRVIVEQLIDVLWQIGGVIGDDGDRARVHELVRARLEPRKRALSWGAADALLGKPKPTKDDDDALLVRRNVLFTMGELGDDEATIAEADTLAKAWLQDPKSLDIETGALALELGSRRADRSRFDALVAAIKKLDDPRDRIAALQALGGFDDPNLVVRALDFAFSTELSLKDIRYVFDGIMRHRRSLPTLAAWIQTNWDRAVKRLEGPRAGRLITPVHALCDRKAIAAARAFYEKRPVEGGVRALQDGLAQAERCTTLSEALRPGLQTALEKRTAERPRPK